MNGSRLFLIGSGVVSLVVILYASFLHGIMLVLAVTDPSLDQMTAFFSRLLGSPAFIGLHIAICILGPMLAIVFIVHACRNPGISLSQRLVWIPALATGYGLIFYWYLHILHGHRGSTLSNALHSSVPLN